MADFLSTLFGGGAEQEAADKNRALLSTYQKQGQGYLQQGYDTGTTDLNKALGAYTPLSDLAGKYNQAGNLYLGALGAGGPQGTAAAQAAFTNAPGYQGAVTAGLDAINRRRGVGGMYNSGNADIDAQTFGQNLQNQQYNSWLQNLGSAGQLGANLTGTTAAGQAGQYGNLASLANQFAGAQTSLLGGTTAGLESANTAQAAGEAAGAKNLLNFGMQAAQMAMGMGSALGGSGGVSAVPGAIGPTSLGGQPLGKSPTLFGGLFG